MMYFLVRKEIKRAKRIVIKIGTNALTKNGEFNHDRIDALAKEIVEMQKEGKEFVIISSGAVGIGKTIRKGNKHLHATLGQVKMMNSYTKCFNKHDLLTSQLLLTKNEFSSKEQLKHVKELLEYSLDLGIIMIINENDSLSHEKNTFGDNDLLSGEITKLINADLQILLTSVDGIYKNKNKDLLDYTTNLKNASKFITDEKSALGTGGMRSKLESAKIANKKTIVAHSKNTIKEILNGCGTIIDF